VRYIKALLIAALALAAFSSIAASANAATLPSLLLLSGTTSATLTATSTTAKTAFAGIVSLTGTGYTFTLKSNFEMTSLGTALLTFTNTLFGAKKCKSPGDTTGNVLVEGEWHTVLALGGRANLFLILILITPALRLECEGTNVVVSGDLLFDAEPFGSEVTSIPAKSGKCSGNTPEFTVYENDAGEMIAVNLKSETGGLKSAACLQVEGTQTYTASQMAEVMEP